MTKTQHIEEAERLLAQVDTVRQRADNSGFEADRYELDRLVAMAQVHALLAVAAQPGVHVATSSDEREV